MGESGRAVGGGRRVEGWGRFEEVGIGDVSSAWSGSWSS
eukprot:SAG31_NODE_32861_length_351_cov_0.376984_1_plen_38_part_01